MASSPRVRSDVLHRGRARQRSKTPRGSRVESTTRSKNDPDYEISSDRETRPDCETGDDLAEEYMRMEREFDESKETRRLYAKSSDGLIRSMKRSWTRYINILPPASAFSPFNERRTPLKLDRPSGTVSPSAKIPARVWSYSGSALWQRSYTGS
jgi:hypothetical protein